MTLAAFDDSAQRAFESATAAHIDKASGLRGTRVAVTGAQAGSVVVDFEITPVAGTSAGVCNAAVTQALQQADGIQELASALSTAMDVELTVDPESVVTKETVIPPQATMTPSSPPCRSTVVTMSWLRFLTGADAFSAIRTAPGA